MPVKSLIHSDQLLDNEQWSLYLVNNIQTEQAYLIVEGSNEAEERILCYAHLFEKPRGSGIAKLNVVQVTQREQLEDLFECIKDCHVNGWHRLPRQALEQFQLAVELTLIKTHNEQWRYYKNSVLNESAEHEAATTTSADIDNVQRRARLSRYSMKLLRDTGHDSLSWAMVMREFILSSVNTSNVLEVGRFADFNFDGIFNFVKLGIGFEDFAESSFEDAVDASASFTSATTNYEHQPYRVRRILVELLPKTACFLDRFSDQLPDNYRIRQAYDFLNNYMPKFTKQYAQKVVEELATEGMSYTISGADDEVITRHLDPVSLSVDLSDISLACSLDTIYQQAMERVKAALIDAYQQNYEADFFRAQVEKSINPYFAKKLQDYLLFELSEQVVDDLHTWHIDLLENNQLMTQYPQIKSLSKLFGLMDEVCKISTKSNPVNRLLSQDQLDYLLTHVATHEDDNSKIKPYVQKVIELCPRISRIGSFINIGLEDIVAMHRAPTVFLAKINAKMTDASLEPTQINYDAMLENFVVIIRYLSQIQKGIDYASLMADNRCTSQRLQSIAKRLMRITNHFFEFTNTMSQLREVYQKLQSQSILHEIELEQLPRFLAQVEQLPLKTTLCDSLARFDYYLKKLDKLAIKVEKQQQPGFSRIQSRLPSEKIYARPIVRLRDYFQPLANREDDSLAVNHRRILTEINSILSAARIEFSQMTKSNVDANKSLTLLLKILNEYEKLIDPTIVTCPEERSFGSILTKEPETFTL